MTLFSPYGVYYNDSSQTITGTDSSLQVNLKLPRNFDGCNNTLKIGAYSFQGKKIISIDLSDTVITDIYYHAFCFCSNLESIIFPKTLESLGVNAFSGTELTEITIPEATKTLTGYSFNQNAKLDILKVDPNNQHFRAVNNFIFSYDLKMLVRAPIHFEFEDIPLFNNVSGIGDKAFSGSTLTRFIASSNIAYLHRDCFHACISLDFIDLSKANISIIETRLFSQGNTLNYKTIILPMTAKVIQTNVFNARHFKTLVIPSTIEQIESGAFKDITSLKNIFVFTSKSFENPAIFSSEYSLRAKVHVSEFNAGETFGGVKVIKDASRALLSCFINPAVVTCKPSAYQFLIQFNILLVNIALLL